MEFPFPSRGRNGPADREGVGRLFSRSGVEFRACAVGGSARDLAHEIAHFPAVMGPWLLLGWLLVALVPGIASAQTPGLKQAVESRESENAAATVLPGERRAKLEKASLEARERLARLDAPGAAAALPEGISVAELDERRRNLEQLVLTIGRALKNLSVVEEARRALETSRAEEAGWTGFKTQPPYSLLMIDDLLNEREAIRSNLGSAEASLGNYERLLATILEEAKDAEEAGNNALAAVQKSGADTVAAAKWRLEAALGRSRLLAARAGLFQNMIDSQKDRIAAAKTDLTLLERQLKVTWSPKRHSSHSMPGTNRSCGALPAA